MKQKWLPSLFEEADPNPSPAAGFCQGPKAKPKRDDSDDLPWSDWKEVAQSVFDSWSNLRQLKYCYDRDIDGALYAPNDEEALWFKARADSYAAEMKTCLRG